MKGIINIGYSESLAISIKLSSRDFELEMKRSSLVKLYELGRISSGMAADVLGISRLDFLDLLAEYKVSFFDGLTAEELDDDLANALGSYQIQLH